MRPSSSLSRPGTSLSTHRPTSRLSQRPTSSASRLSVRPPSRHAQRFSSHIEALVAHLTGLSTGDDDDFQETCDLASMILETHRYTGLAPDMRQIDARFDGLIEKAQIKGQDVLGSAMSEIRRLLGTAVRMETDRGEPEIRDYLLPSHLHLLLELARIPTAETQDKAREILDKIRNPPNIAPTLTWADIVAEEPLEGDHWDLPPSPSSSTSSDQWSDLHEAQESVPVAEVPPVAAAELVAPTEDCTDSTDPSREAERQRRINAERSTVEAFQERQYWTSKWAWQPNTKAPFKFSDPSTLGPTLDRTLQKNAASVLEKVVYIREVNAVREVLLGLQGCVSCLFETRQSILAVEVRPVIPRLLHISIDALKAVLASFADLTTTLYRLRTFISAIHELEDPARVLTDTPMVRFVNFKSLSAFTEGLESTLHQFDQWCSDREGALYTVAKSSDNPSVATLLDLQRAVRDYDVDIFATQWTILRDLLGLGNYFSASIINLRLNTLSPAFVSQTLLDQLLRRSQTRLSMGRHSAASRIQRLFVLTARPQWEAVGVWLKNGVMVEEDGPHHYISTQGQNPEFFINSVGDLSTMAWDEVAVLRSNPTSTTTLVPKFLEAVGTAILSTGKAVGLLRALEVDDFFFDQQGPKWLLSWASLDSLLWTQGEEISETINRQESEGAGASSEVFTTDAIITMIQEHVDLPCHLAQSRLRRVLVEEWHIWDHLECIEDVFLMGRGDIISQFAQNLFVKIDSHKPWTDYHVLNGLFREVIASNPCNWVEPSAVRLSFHGDEEPSISRMIKTLDGIAVDYQAPFPINAVFSPDTIKKYSEIFTFLLQLRRAKAVLDQMLIKGIIQTSADVATGELKAFYALRGKLTWVVNTYTNYVMTFVLHVRVLRVHERLHNANSLDEMISIHEQHVDDMLEHCFLNSEATPLHRSVTAILELCVAFYDTFVAFTSDMSFDTSRHSMISLRERRRSSSVPRRKRRLRKSQKRLRRNLVGLPEDMAAVTTDEDSDSSEDVDVSHIIEEGESLNIGAMSFEEESFLARVDNMSSKLDDLVRYIHRGADALATDENSTFSVLSFMLEDWDR